MSSALINRLIHIHLVSSPRDWLAWAAGHGIHHWVLEYIALRPDHLSVAPPKHEETFSSPRSWHMLSDALHSYGEAINEKQLEVAAGCLSLAHATQFRAFVKQIRRAWDLDAVLKGNLNWPSAAGDRDVLYFLATSFKARLVKELPRDRAGAPASAVQLAHRAKGLLTELAEISLEVAQSVVTAGPGGSDDEELELPAWFLTEAVRDLPRLVLKRPSEPLRPTQ